MSQPRRDVSQVKGSQSEGQEQDYDYGKKALKHGDVATKRLDPYIEKKRSAVVN
jgi:hypothetical protein